MEEHRREEVFKRELSLINFLIINSWMVKVPGYKTRITYVFIFNRKDNTTHCVLTVSHPKFFSL